jgi:hypothetical protein
VQHYDTSVPTGTTSTGASWKTTTQGAFTFTSTVQANATPCNLTPASFAGKPFEVSVVKCEPKWRTDPNDHIAHLVPPTPPDPIRVYLDPSTLSAARSALDDAIGDWNSHISATGITFQRVDSSCGSGPDCITVQAVPDLGSCGYRPPLQTDSNGGYVGNMYLQIDGSWNTWSSQSLQRTFAHELGHFLGIGDYSTTSACDATGNAAVMQPNFVCSSASTPLTATSFSDYRPVNNTTYGGKSRLTCGF